MQEHMVDEFQAMVDRLAARVQQSVAIDDPDGNLMAISKHYGDEDGYRVKLVLERQAPPEYRSFFGSFVQGLVDGALESPIRVPANPALSVVGRIGYAIKAMDRVVAILWFIDRGTDLPGDTVEDYCAALGAVLAQRHSRQLSHGPKFAGESIRKLLSGESMDEDEVTRWLAAAQTEFVVLATLAAPDDSSGRAAAKAALQKVPRSLQRRRLSLSYVTRMDGLDVAVYGRPMETVQDAGQETDHSVENADPDFPDLPHTVGAGLSGPGEVVSLRRLYVEAALAAFVSLHLHRHSGVLRAGSVSGLIPILATPLDAREAPPLQKLKGLLADADGFAYETVGATLHSDGSQSHIVELLNIHRTTLHYRTTQIEQHTGLNLQAPADLFLAVNVWLRVAAARSGIGHLLVESQDAAPVASHP